MERHVVILPVAFHVRPLHLTRHLLSAPVKNRPTGDSGSHPNVATQNLRGSPLSDDPARQSLPFLSIRAVEQ
jgi:hypothetical protein